MDATMDERWRRRDMTILRLGNVAGYRSVTLCSPGVQRARRVHLLVLAAFGQPKPSRKYECNHIDGDKANNRIENLEWVTSSENTRHAIEVGLMLVHGEDNPAAKLTRDDIPIIRRRAAQGEGYARIARDFPVCREQVRNIVLRRKWKHVK